LKRHWLWIELAAVFGAAPGLLALGPRRWVLPAILLGGAISLVVLVRDPTFAGARLLDAAAARRGLGRVLARTALVWTALLLLALQLRGASNLFLLPRARPGVWLAVVIFYPLLSAYPQEIMFRAFFFHRYAPLFRRPGLTALASAALFGWAHVIVHNRLAMALATAGGLLFATTYQRSRSTLLVGVEHALYGLFLFSVGLGGMFTNSVRIFSGLMKR
jgi:hypothetical protein